MLRRESSSSSNSLESFEVLNRNAPSASTCEPDELVEIMMPQGGKKALTQEFRNNANNSISSDQNSNSKSNTLMEIKSDITQVIETYTEDVGKLEFLEKTLRKVNERVLEFYEKTQKSLEDVKRSEKHYKELVGKLENENEKLREENSTLKKEMQEVRGNVSFPKEFVHEYLPKKSELLEIISAQIGRLELNLEKEYNNYDEDFSNFMPVNDHMLAMSDVETQLTRITDENNQLKAKIDQEELRKRSKCSRTRLCDECLVKQNEICDLQLKIMKTRQYACRNISPHPFFSCQSCSYNQYLILEYKREIEEKDQYLRNKNCKNLVNPESD